MTTKTYDNNEDGLPILTKKGGDTHTEDGLPILGKSATPVKKKEDLGVGSHAVLTDGQTGAKFITLSPEEERDFNRRMGKVKPVEEQDDDFIKDPVKNISKPYRDKILQTNTEYRQSGLRNRQVSESTNLTGIGNKGDLKESYERDLRNNYHRLEGITNEVVKQILPNGKAAVQYVQQQVQKNGGKIPEGNETFNIAAGKAIQYTYLKDKVANGKSLTQIGVDMEREVDPNFDKQISLLEQDANSGKRTGESGMGTDIYDNVIPATTQFNITNRLIHQPDVDLIASENPKVKAELDDLRNGGLYNRFPEGGIAEMSNELSRERMKMGRNNAIANPIFNSSGFMDRLAEKLYKDTPWKLEFYNKYLKGKLQGKLDTPGLVDEFGTGAKETFEQMGASLKDVVGLGDSRAERVYSELEKEGGHVSSGVEGALKWAGQAARFGGMIAAMSTGGGVLKATKLNPTAINAIVAADTFYDTELNAWTMKYPDQPEKAQLGAILTTALFSAGGKVFPSSQVADIAAKKMAPEVKAAIANMESGVISKEAKKTLVDKFAQVLKETVKGTGEATAVVAGVNAFENAFDQVAGDPNIIAKYHPDSRILEEAKGMVIGSLFPQLMIAYKGRNAVGNSLLDISERPEVFRQTSKEMMESGKITAEEYNKKLEDITFLSQLKDQLDKFRVDPKNQRRFLVEALNEKNIKERNATLPESAITRRTNKELTRTAEIQERILNGEDVVKVEERAEMPKEDVSILDRAIESAGETIKVSLQSDHPESEKIAFLKEQSLDAPKGLKDQLGGNEELVTDIIAINSRKEIEDATERLHKRLKETDFDDPIFNEIDEHITLLEKGLEKNEQKPKVRITAEELEAAQPSKAGYTPKDGAEYGFSQNEELSKVGTVEEYSKYLDTVFPNSKIKNILYRTALEEYMTDTESGLIFMSPDIDYGKILNKSGLKKTVAILVNIESPVSLKGVDFYSGKKDDIKTLEGGKYDAIVSDVSSIRKDPPKNSEIYEVAVPSSDQIHILGSKADVERFKKWKNENKSKKSEVIQEPIKSPEPAKEIKDSDKKVYYAGEYDGKKRPELMYLTQNKEYAKNFGGKVIEYEFNPKKTLDASELGEKELSANEFKSFLDKHGVGDVSEKIREEGFEHDMPFWMWIRRYPEVAKSIREAGFDSIIHGETFSGRKSEKVENTIISLNSSEVKKRGEPAKAGEQAAVPPSTPEAGQAPPEIPTETKEVISGGEDTTGITHAQMDAAARELGLQEYEGKPETFEQWDAEATERLKQPGSIEKVLKKMENNRRVEPVENQMLKRYVASLKARINASPTPELLEKFDRVKGLSNLAGRNAAKELVSRRGMVPVEDSLADYLEVRSKDKGRNLTETQIKEEKEKYDRKKKAEAEYEDSLEKDKQKAAEAEFEKETKKRTPRDRKSREEYVSERAKLLIQMKEKWKNAGKDTLSSDIPYRQQLAAIAPEVAKIIKSHIAEGVDNLADLVDKVYEDVKDYVESKKEVRDFIVYGADEKKKVPLSKETIAARDRLIKINKEIEEVRQNDQYENLSFWQKKWDQAQNVLGIRRLVQTSMDASILLRQLGQLAFNPRKWKQFYEAAKATAKIVKSAKNYDRIMFEIKEQPDYAESVKDGVRYNQPEALDSEKRNELYGASRKSFVYKIPILRHIMGSSQRIADGTLNVARYELYQKYKKALIADKIYREEHPEVYEEMAKLVMNTTGSGNLLGMFENAKAQKVLGSVFYGARLMAANFNSLNPIYYAKITKKNKRLGYEAMKDLASYTATLMATGLALAAAGGNISLDPNSPEFLQFRFGKKVYDITGGKAAYIRTFLRWVEAGHARALKTKHESAKATEFAAESTMRFFRNKLSPNTSYAYTWTFGQGKNAIGQDADPLEFVKIWPMYADDAWKAAKEDGMLSLMTVLLPNLLGIGYNSYYSEPSKQPLEDLIDRNTRSDEQNKELIKNYKDGGREITNKEFEEYAEKRDAEIERMLTILYNEGAYVAENGKAVLKPFKDLSKEEIIRETSIIKQDATAKVKEEIFGKKKETGKQKHSEEKVERERKKLYK